MTDKVTPLIKQYLEIKKQYPDRILFFRMGDFYEMLGEDARVAAQVLGIALTSRNHGKSGKIPLAGVPYHQAEKYLAMLLKAGYSVAVCEQTEDPRLAKGLVKREVVEVITPGSVTLPGVIDDGIGNFLAALNIERDQAGLALLDYGTGEFILDEMPIDRLDLAIAHYQPAELLLPDDYAGPDWKIPVARTEHFRFTSDFAVPLLLRHFGVVSLDGFGCADMKLAVGAAGALLDYLGKLKKGQLDHLRSMKRAATGEVMFLDQATIANLEILQSSSGSPEFSLLWYLDRCLTPMGKRLLRRRLTAPLKVKDLIDARLRMVSAFHDDVALCDEIGPILRGIRDIERLVSRFVAGRAGPRDLVILRESIKAAGELKKRLGQARGDFKILTEEIDDLGDVAPQLFDAIVDEPPVSYLEGRIFRRGYWPELDRLKDSISDAQQYIRTLQDRERQRTGIGSLKVGYNKVFGYYIEITNAHRDKVPPGYIRKQTLVSAERYITEEMKEKEELILKAEEKINLLEAELFLKIRTEIKALSSRILKTARAVAEIDFFRSLAVVARAHGLTKPEIRDAVDDPNLAIHIVGGRHPMVERALPPGEFVPNDTRLDVAKNRLHIITGPNMAGKSTYLRQVGLIVLLAQIGSFVPAEAATITLVDRIFTRVGAADRLAYGQSTFMVEMSDTANIVNNATRHSLILLDELGRGTSTYDGLAMAWAITEYICQVPTLGCRTLFATHYHELTEMASDETGIVNYQATVKKVGDRIIFLRKIVPGGCDDSYGIEVARLAGLPSTLIDRAKVILSELEEKNPPAITSRHVARRTAKALQISLFELPHADLIQKLRAVDINAMTPIEALNLLKRLKDDLNEH